MRVLFLHLEEVWSGTGRAVLAAADGLARRGHRIDVCAPPDTPLARRASDSGYDVVHATFARDDVRGVLQLRRVLRERSVDVVVVHTDREHVIGALASRTANRAAIVRRMQAGAGSAPPGWRWRAARWVSTTCYLVTGGEDELLPGEAIRGEWAPVVGELGVDLAAVDGGRSTSRPTPRPMPSTRTIVCVCSRETLGRARLALRAVALLAARHPELRLVLAGAGSDDADLTVHAAALGITGIVSQVGDPPDVLAVLRTADIGWVFARGDTGAFAFLDFMSLRVLPVSTSDRFAERYIADGISGVLFRSDREADVAAAIAALIADDDRRLAMGNAARARVARQFTHAGMIDAFERAATPPYERGR